MKLIDAIFLTVATLIAGCAQTPGKESAIAATGSREHAAIDYGKYLKNQIDSFMIFRLDDWDSTDIGHVVVWSGRNDAHLLTLSGACLALNNASGLGVTSHGSSVHAGIDYVIVDSERCRIESIQRLDGSAIRAELKAQAKTAESAKDAPSSNEKH